MKSSLILVTLLCFALQLHCQILDEKQFLTPQDEKQETLERINHQGAHSINAYYGYFYYKEGVDNRLYAWNANIFALGYLYSVARNINVGIYGRYRSYVTDEAKWRSSYTNQDYIIYKYNTSSYDILFKGQFFWINTSYIGFYSSLNLGVAFMQPFKTEFISGSGNIPPYYGGFYDGGDFFTPFGLRFRFGKAANWYLNLELVMRFNDERAPLLYGAGYRF